MTQWDGCSHTQCNILRKQLFDEILQRHWTLRYTIMMGQRQCAFNVKVMTHIHAQLVSVRQCYKVIQGVTNFFPLMQNF